MSDSIYKEPANKTGNFVDDQIFAWVSNVLIFVRGVTNDRADGTPQLFYVKRNYLNSLQKMRKNQSTLTVSDLAI